MGAKLRHIDKRCRIMQGLLVLNEASLPFPCLLSCQEGLVTFFSILQRAHVKKLRFFHCEGGADRSWAGFLYAEGFEFGHWLNDIDTDLRLTVKDVLANVYCPSVASHQQLAELFPERFIHFLASDPDVETVGLGIANLLSGHGLSFSSSPKWTHEEICVIRQWDEGGSVTSVELSVPNVHSVAALDNALSRIIAEAQQHRTYFHNLTEENNDDFPNLIFCRSAIKDLQNPSNTPLDFKNLVHALNQLNDSVVRSKSVLELIEQSGLDISGESDATLNNRKLLLRRQFNHPHLGPTIFEHHVKNFNAGKRLHFLIDFDGRKLCIGYFGKHLPT